MPVAIADTAEAAEFARLINVGDHARSQTGLQIEHMGIHSDEGFEFRGHIGLVMSLCSHSTT